MSYLDAEEKIAALESDSFNLDKKFMEAVGHVRDLGKVEKQLREEIERLKDGIDGYKNTILLDQKEIAELTTKNFGLSEVAKTLRETIYSHGKKISELTADYDAIKHAYYQLGNAAKEQKKRISWVLRFLESDGILERKTVVI